MEQEVQFLLGLDVETWKIFFSIIFALGAIIVGIYAGVKALKKEMGYETKTEKRFKKDEETLATLAEEVNSYKENRVHDRAQSKEIQHQLVGQQNELRSALSDLKDAVSSIVIKMDEIEEKNNKRTRAELKDRISQAYRYHSRHGEWTAMDKESFEDLIAEYEAAGGKNSFVHSICCVDMYKWKIIDKHE